MWRLFCLRRFKKLFFMHGSPRRENEASVHKQSFLYKSPETKWPRRDICLWALTNLVATLRCVCNIILILYNIRARINCIAPLSLNGVVVIPFPLLEVLLLQGDRNVGVVGNSHVNEKTGFVLFALWHNVQLISCDGPVSVLLPIPFSWIGSNVQQKKPLRMHCNTSKCM